MSDDSIHERIESEAKRALVQNAFFRLESAIMVSATILLSVFFSQPFPGWPWWGWLALGLAGEAAIVVSSLTDKSEQQRVIDSLFHEQYNTSGIRDRELRAKLDEAERYHQRIQQLVQQQRGGLLRDRMADTTGQVYDWIAGMVRLARRIDAYRNDEIVRRDRPTVVREIQELTTRMSREKNRAVLDEIAATLASKHQLAENLDELENRMARADLQLDHSLTALGTVYSQMLLIGSSEMDSNRTERLRDDIRGEVAALQDLVASINEVFGSDLSASADAGPASATSSAARGRQSASSGR